MKQIPATLTTLLMGVVITIASLWIGQNHHLLPEQVSLQAPLVDRFFDLMVTIAAALFFIVQGALVLFLIQYRRRAGDDTDGSPIEGNIPLEIVWTAIPSVIVVGLGIYSVQVYADMGGIQPPDPSMAMAHHQTHSDHDGGGMLGGSAIAAPLLDDGTSADAADLPEPDVQLAQGLGITGNPGQAEPDLVVNVQGLQYAWLFNYPNSGITTGELHVPIGQDVKLNISAMDVIHSFWVPQFRLKQDAIPGKDTYLRFTATKTGTYPVVCAELCGGYHGSMRTSVVVHSPEEYEAWVSDNRIAAAVKTEPATNQLALRSADLGINADTLADLHS